MRYVNLTTWPRREHFAFFKGMEFPHFNVCANVDITAFYEAVKAHNVSFTVATVYVIARTANAIPEFRYRIRDNRVVEHPVVHPGTTILISEDVFTFCVFDYSEDFSQFVAQAAQQIAHVREHPTLTDEQWQDDMIYMTPLPWVSFTSVMHPLALNPVDSVPRFAWGKFFEEGNRLKMPLSVQAHHALLDGIHAGRYYARAQEFLSEPDRIFGEMPLGQPI